jgi:transcription elongation GreA/GreB family factor
MDKTAVIQKILDTLQTELETYTRAAKFSHAEATAEENRAENKYDTRGLEASYLAAGQANKVMELEASLETFEGLKEQPVSDAIEIGSLVELQQDGFVEWYFLGPTAGGTEIEIDDTEVLVITPESPLGSQIMGLEAGAKASLELGGRTQKAVVQAVL